MTRDVKATMIEGAARLLARQGLQRTSFSEVLEATGAPRGSVYHHFPDGKDEMVLGAVRLAGDRALAALDASAGSAAVAVAERFLGLWREVLVRSEFGSGCAVLAVTVAADSPDLLDEAAGVFRRWRGRLAELLEQGGLAPEAATTTAVTLIAASEGAVVVSRAERDLEPFETVAAQLLGMVRAAAR